MLSHQSGIKKASINIRNQKISYAKALCVFDEVITRIKLNATYKQSIPIKYFIRLYTC